MFFLKNEIKVDQITVNLTVTKALREVPAHVAARKGHVAVLEVLAESANLTASWRNLVLVLVCNRA